MENEKRGDASDIRQPAGTDNLSTADQFRVPACASQGMGQGEGEGEHDKVLDARESKPEGSRTKVQRRKPPSAKAPKSEGC